VPSDKDKDAVDLILIWIILMLHQGMEDDADLKGMHHWSIWKDTV
jgi:hypothetical protein